MQSVKNNIDYFTGQW